MIKKQSDYTHNSQTTTGILVTNLGSPDEATPEALKRYLAEFLWDPRVVEIPRPIWWLILNVIILNTRPKKSAEAYKQVWTEQGSPLLVNSKNQAQALEMKLTSQIKGPVKVVLGMRYGNPSIESAMQQLQDANVNQLLVFPLYPQHSAATTASTIDAVNDTFKKWRYVPNTRFISHYHDNDAYINAVAESIQQYWDKTGKKAKRLMFSFHGMPRVTRDYGDPYHCQCHKTARLITKKLSLNDDEWIIAFQSRFGKQEWLKPYANETLKTLGEQKLDSLDVVCPGFSADCLETLEEMAVENKEVFVTAGGGEYRYIPALNDSASHIDALSGIIMENLKGWQNIESFDENASKQATADQKDRAVKLGAKQ